MQFLNDSGLSQSYLSYNHLMQIKEVANGLPRKATQTEIYKFGQPLEVNTTWSVVMLKINSVGCYDENVNRMVIRTLIAITLAFSALRISGKLVHRKEQQIKLQRLIAKLFSDRIFIYKTRKEAQKHLHSEEMENFHKDDKTVDYKYKTRKEAQKHLHSEEMENFHKDDKTVDYKKRFSSGSDDAAPTINVFKFSNPKLIGFMGQNSGGFTLMTAQLL
uniref:Uncharacterized protein n=1 Tax=Glossina palpalis gambiensis TaxID=67801 RepID=A0A1B0B0P2_9MUSC